MKKVLFTIFSLFVVVFGKKNNTNEKNNFTTEIQSTTSLPSYSTSIQYESTSSSSVKPTKTHTSHVLTTTKTNFFDMNFFCGEGIELKKDLSNVVCDLPCESGLEKDCPPDYSCFNVPNYCVKDDNNQVFLPNSSNSYTIFNISRIVIILLIFLII
jgi:hypothetical protein